MVSCASRHISDGSQWRPPLSTACIPVSCETLCTRAKPHRNQQYVPSNNKVLRTFCIVLLNSVDCRCKTNWITRQRTLSINMPPSEKCILENVVCDLDLWTHDLENVIIVISFIKVRPCTPELMPPKVLVWPYTVSLWALPLTYWSQYLCTQLHQSCTGCKWSTDVSPTDVSPTNFLILQENVQHTNCCVPVATFTHQQCLLLNNYVNCMSPNFCRFPTVFNH